MLGFVGADGASGAVVEGERVDLVADVIRGVRGDILPVGGHRQLRNEAGAMGEWLPHAYGPIETQDIDAVCRRRGDERHSTAARDVERADVAGRNLTEPHVSPATLEPTARNTDLHEIVDRSRAGDEENDGRARWRPTQPTPRATHRHAVQ